MWRTVDRGFRLHPVHSGRATALHLARNSLHQARHLNLARAEAATAKSANRSMASATSFQHHQRLYLADGNVCLSALWTSQPSLENQTAIQEPSVIGTIFRVHQSILSIHSDIFRDMFSLPSTQGTNETYDGVPLVQMPDSAEDLEALLAALYYG